MTDGNSKKNKTKILKKQKYIGGSTLSNNEIKIIENQLASANKSAVIAEIKSNELETMVDQIAEAEKDPTKSANLDVITKEIDYARSIPTTSLVLAATNAATTADIASRDVYYAVNTLNKTLKEPTNVTIGEITYTNVNNDVTKNTDTIYIKNEKNENNENKIILHAKKAAERALNASRKAQGLAVTAANKTRKLRDLASLKRLKSLGKGISSTAKATGRGIGLAVETTREGINSAATNIGDKAKKTNEVTSKKLCERLKSLNTQLTAKLAELYNKLDINCNINNTPDLTKTKTKIEKILEEIDEFRKNLDEISITGSLQKKKEIIGEIAKKERELIALSITITMIETAARTIFLQIKATQSSINTLGGECDIKKINPCTDNANQSVEVIENLQNGGAIDIESTSTMYDKIKDLAKKAREGSRTATSKALSARAIGLKSRGEAAVGFLKESERRYREKVKAQEKDMKVKGLKKKEGPQNIAATKSPDFEIESKVYPLPFVNSKGFRIGNYKVFINTDLLPFTGVDQADHYLLNLFDYVNYEGTPVEKDKKKDISQFFNSTNHKFKAFTPIKYPDESRSTFLERQQIENEKEYKHLRERARLFMNELAEMGKAGDPVKRKEIKDKIKSELDSINNETGTTNEEKERQKQVILSEYLNAIDELEHGLKEDFKPLFNEALSKDNEGKSIIEPTNVGGKKKKRKNNLRSSQKKKGKRKNKTLKNKKK